MLDYVTLSIHTYQHKNVTELKFISKLYLATCFGDKSASAEIQKQLNIKYQYINILCRKNKKLIYNDINNKGFTELIITLLNIQNLYIYIQSCAYKHLL